MTPSLRTIAVSPHASCYCPVLPQNLKRYPACRKRGRLTAKPNLRSLTKRMFQRRSSLQIQMSRNHPLKQTPLMPLAPPPTEPVPPPEDGNSGSNGDLDGHDDENGRGFVRSQSGPSERLREAPPKVKITEPGNQGSGITAPGSF